MHLDNILKTIILVGSKGRMGKAISEVSANYPNPIKIIGIDPLLSLELTPQLLSTVDVVVDFSSPSGTKALLEAAAIQPVPIVTGTTGLDQATLETLITLSEKMAVIHASNFSLGINLFLSLAALSAKALGPDFHPEIMEIHHQFKKDAPSGTALSIAQAVADAAEIDKSNFIKSRDGHMGTRPENSVGISALRGGDVVGEHTLYFLGEGERIEISHKATDRIIFAKGAMRATSWIINQKPGFYSMAQVLGL
jgi:4-hydroxy-tetrahydrodipicolinate reductase